jgi:uncharacterized protein YdeI (YjbR/CyaY-like superfamily)
MQESVRFRSREEWRAWLQEHHLTAKEIWLIFAKKGASIRTISYNDTVEEAICFGWIDGKVRSIDDQRFMQRYTPRKPSSSWSETNIQRANGMIARGLMTEPGLKAYQDGMARGRIVPSIRNFSVPPDLEAALVENERARENFSRMSPSAQMLFASWVTNAKKAETREMRLKKSVELLSANKKLTDVMGPGK